MAVKRFLDKDMYETDFRETALAHVSMFLRNNAQWQLLDGGDSFEHAGWRFRKQLFAVKSATNLATDKYVLVWCEYGPDFALSRTNLADMKYLAQQLQLLQHPALLESIVELDVTAAGLLQVKKYDEKLVSLRDYVCNVSSAKQALQTSFLKKYAVQKSYRTMSLEQVRHVSRQILLALNFIYNVKVKCSRFFLFIVAIKNLQFHSILKTIQVLL